MKRKILLFAGLIIIVLSAFILHLLNGTGFFRHIDKRVNGELVAELNLKGPEDFAISYVDSFLLISSTERKKYPPEEEESGSIFILNLKSQDQFSVLNLTTGLAFPFAPHGISMLKKDSTYLVKVINHTEIGHSIEIFELFNRDSLAHIRSLEDRSMIAPNDLIQVDTSRFYFTNDRIHEKGFGLFMEEFLGIGYSSVIYFDGETYHEVAGGLSFANGINLDRNRNLLYVGASRGFKVHVFATQKDGQLKKLKEIQCKMGVDNINIDNNGNLWVAGHPNLLIYQEYAQRKRKTSPSEIVKINQDNNNEFHKQSIYLEDGTLISGSTVACSFGAFTIIGSALDDKLVILTNLEKVEVE